MAVGTVETSVLTDIANAIRFQAGVATTYKPRQMAAAVAALDGTDAGGYRAQPYKELEAGVLPDSVFAGIADAIRGQNGSDAAYRPDEMAAAILALTWDVGLKPRALLLSDGTLEFNYLDRRRSALGGTVVAAWEAATGGYASTSDRPWHERRGEVARVAFDASFAGAGVTSLARWFQAFPNLVEVTGFEAVSGVTDVTLAFSNCPNLESVYATEFDSSAITTATSCLFGCVRLVGGTDGYVPPNTATKANFKVGENGALTDPAADSREWCRCFLYADGELVLTAAAAPEDGREVSRSGRICVNARYSALGYQPWSGLDRSVAAVTVKPDMMAYSSTNMNYLFYGCALCERVSGLRYLPRVGEMRYTFTSCAALTELDFTGFDNSHLTSLFYTFSGCSALTTIYAHSTWTLPGNVTRGTQTFYNCKALVGGAGTAWESGNAGYERFRIDRDGEPGYLTSSG